MAKFKNISPLGALDLPLVGRVVERGETFDVPDDKARHLAGQEDTWAPVKGGKALPPSNAPSGPQEGAHDQEGGEQP